MDNGHEHEYVEKPVDCKTCHGKGYTKWVATSYDHITEFDENGDPITEGPETKCYDCGGAGFVKVKVCKICGKPYKKSALGCIVFFCMCFLCLSFFIFSNK